VRNWNARNRKRIKTITEEYHIMYVCICMCVIAIIIRLKLNHRFLLLHTREILYKYVRR
jgi:hypothetical protein